MEILYLTAVLAVIALCIALFSTARRILHSTPLTNGDLSITQMERLTQSWEPIAQRSFEETVLPLEKPETEHAEDNRNEDNLNMDEYLLPQVNTVLEVHREEFVAPSMQISTPEPPRDLYYSEAPQAPEIHIQPKTILEDKIEVQPKAMYEDWMKVQPQAIREDRIEAQPRAVRENRMEISSPRTPHYLLECLLIGVSVFVLVKTQKSTAQYRSERAVNRVA
ncbi:MAG: hypothetical protein ABI076_05720 [Acidobacteriaceae bacterium]